MKTQLIDSHSTTVPLLKATLPKVTALENGFLLPNFRDLESLVGAANGFFGAHNADEIGGYRYYEYNTPIGRDGVTRAYVGEYLGIKTEFYRPDNFKIGVNTKQSAILLFDRVTALPCGAINTTELAPLNTVVSSLVAFQSWIESTQASEIRLGFVGAGAVAAAHLRAFYHLYGDKIVDTKVCSAGDSASRLVAEIGSRYPCRVASLAEVTSSSNVIVSATSTAPHNPVVNLKRISLMQGQPVFLAGVGFNDLSRSVYEAASTIVSDNPLPYGDSSLDLAKSIKFLGYGKGPGLISLSEIVSGGKDMAENGLTLYMPYGSAMLDLALCLRGLGLDSSKSALQS